MTWITDMPELAKTIAENGALPSLALGPRSASELQRDFGSLQEIMGDLPYATLVMDARGTVIGISIMLPSSRGGMNSRPRCRAT